MWFRPLSWYADITLDTVALDTPQRLPVLVTDAPVRCAPTICPLFNSDMSSIMLCGLQYFMCSCAIALLVQPSHSAFTDEKSVKIGHQSTHIYPHETSNTILARISVYLSNPCVYIFVLTGRYKLLVYYPVLKFQVLYLSHTRM